MAASTAAARCDRILANAASLRGLTWGEVFTTNCVSSQVTHNTGGGQRGAYDRMHTVFADVRSHMRTPADGIGGRCARVHGLPSVLNCRTVRARRPASRLRSSVSTTSLSAATRGYSAPRARSRPGGTPLLLRNVPSWYGSATPL